MGPILIFDKSTLESLNVDEAVWLDNFFLTNITPLFFIETLADLEKQVRSGRTPEHIVGNLALKSPDMGSYPNVHHATLIQVELSGLQKIDMRYGRPIIRRGERVRLGGRTGVIVEEAPEDKAFQRWQRGEFLELERSAARAWRQSLSNIDYEQIYRSFQKWFIRRKKPKTLLEVKAIADQFIDGPEQEKALRFGLEGLNILQSAQEGVLSRWNAAGKPTIKSFAPYFRYVVSVDLSFYLAIAADLVSRTRPSNKVDLAYLYYLPFCMVFTSSDRLHSRIVPLFARKDQTFIEGSALKTDLARIDQHYSSLPDSAKNQGILEFAYYPPEDTSFLTTQLWDKYLPRWRRHQSQPRKPVSKEDSDAELERIKRLVKEAKPMGPTEILSSDDADSVVIKRRVRPQKGKWKRFSLESENSRKEELSNGTSN